MVPRSFGFLCQVKHSLKLTIFFFFLRDASHSLKCPVGSAAAAARQPPLVSGDAPLRLIHLAKKGYDSCDPRNSRDAGSAPKHLNAA